MIPSNVSSPIRNLEEIKEEEKTVEKLVKK